MRLIPTLAGLLLVTCSSDLSVEQQIIASLRSMEVAAESGQHFSFMEKVAEDFSAQRGAMDRKEFHRFMLFQLNKNRRLHAQFFPIHVEESGEDQAMARFRLLVTGGSGLLPERGQIYAVETLWRRAEDDWLLQTARWEPIQFDP